MMGISLKYLISNEWESYYEGTHTNNNGQLPIADGNFYINEVKFIDKTATAILLNTNQNTTKLLLENAFFNKIFLPEEKHDPSIDYSSEGQCVQSRICTVNTSVTSPNFNGHHGDVRVTKSDSPLYKNYMIDSTISSCGKPGVGVANVCLLFGEIIVNRLNISYSQCATCCCFRIYWPNEGTTKYSTFFNNSAISDLAHALEYEGVKYEGKIRVAKFLYYLNILNNEASKSLLHGEPLVIKNTVIKNNSAQYIFRFPSVTTLMNCYCENTNDNLERIKIKKMRISSYDLLLPHLKSWLCVANLELGFNYEIPVDEILQINKCSNIFWISISI